MSDVIISGIPLSSLSAAGIIWSLYLFYAICSKIYINNVYIYVLYILMRHTMIPICGTIYHSYITWFIITWADNLFLKFHGNNRPSGSYVYTSFLVCLHKRKRNSTIISYCPDRTMSSVNISYLLIWLKTRAHSLKNNV